VEYTDDGIKRWLRHHQARKLPASDLERSTVDDAHTGMALSIMFVLPLTVIVTHADSSVGMGRMFGAVCLLVSLNNENFAPFCRLYMKLRKMRSADTMVTSDFCREAEIWPFWACTVEKAQHGPKAIRNSDSVILFVGNWDWWT